MQEPDKVSSSVESGGAPDVRQAIDVCTAMLAAGEVQQAMKIALAAVAQHGPQPGLSAFLADIAERRGNWSKALGHWQEVIAASPDWPGAEARQAEARRLVDRRTAGTAYPPGEIVLPDGPPPVVTAEQDDDVAALLMRFKSLGANCEFGLLQRKFGCTPLGLMRFASTQPQTLLKLLHSQFAGMGEAGETVVRLPKDEYVVEHPRSGWSMHTRIFANHRSDLAALDAEQLKRISFLRREMLNDLEEHEDIFVYCRPSLVDAQIGKIYAALQEYGPNKLLCVRLGDARHPPGTVEWRTERLMIGAIDTLGVHDDAAGWRFSVDHWIRFCRLAVETFG